MAAFATAVGAGDHGDERLDWLLCDHERHIVRLIQRHMERAGHTVVCTHDGQAAIDETQKRIENGEKVFDKIVLGLLLPKKDGFEVLRWIRTHPQTDKIWVALKIAKSQDYEVFQEMPYTADMYFTDPVNPRDLLR